MKFHSNSINRKLSKLNISIIKGSADVSHLTEVVVDRDKESVAQEWCQEHLQDEWIWSSPIHIDKTMFYFKSADDAMVFKLLFI